MSSLFFIKELASNELWASIDRKVGQLNNDSREPIKVFDKVAKMRMRMRASLVLLEMQKAAIA
jgi:hypothetical protein